jgi:hypothetical protein
MNPTLSDLVGGVHTVTLGDVEARRRRTQKTVLERRAPPTFDILVEIQGWNRVAVHSDVAEIVDRALRGFPVMPENRTLDMDGRIQRVMAESKVASTAQLGRGHHDLRAYPGREPTHEEPQKATHILPYGVNKGKLQIAVRGSNAPVELVSDINSADILLTTKSYYRRNTQPLRTAEEKGKPVYVLRKNTMPQIEQFIKAISRRQADPGSEDGVSAAMHEAEVAVGEIGRGETVVELNPQGAYIRRLQHQIAERHRLVSASIGRDPTRHVVFRRRRQV